MIEVNNLWKVYNKKTPDTVNALSGITFHIFKGEIISIIGKTGSGKSTFANILLGVTKPTYGEIIIDNKLIINKKSKSNKLRNITDFLLLSFQYPDHQLFTKTVKEEILFNSDDEKYMFELIDKFDLEESILEESPFKLSSGQKRKIILISLLIQRPKIIVFDEATAFLDPFSRKEFVLLLKNVNKEFQTTFIFISHNLEDVENISDRVLYLKEGEISFIGDVDKSINLYKKEFKNGQ